MPYNSLIQSVKFNSFQYSQSCTTSRQVQNIFITLKRNLTLLSYNPSSLESWAGSGGGVVVVVSPKQQLDYLLIYFLSLQICLFWTSNINRIIQYVILLCQASVIQHHIFKVHVACISASFFSIAEQYSIVWIWYILFIHLSADGQIFGGIIK